MVSDTLASLVESILNITLVTLTKVSANKIVSQIEIINSVITLSIFFEITDSSLFLCHVE